MSDSTNASANEVSATNDSPNAAAATAQKSMPAWFIAGILGVFLGGCGGFLLAKFGYGNRVRVIRTPANAGENYGLPPTMGAPSAGEPGAGGEANDKRSLAALVGKVELLTRPNFKLTLELNPEQQATLAPELTAIKQMETMTDEDARKRLEAMEALLTPEQKATLDVFSLPRRRGNPGGPSSGAPSMGGGLPEDNPFAQDQTNQQRLDDLLGRLPPPADEETAKTP
jgi:hypothetical protein